MRQLREIKYATTRGTVSFQREQGIHFQQWLDVPYVTYQFTEDSNLSTKPCCCWDQAANLTRLQQFDHLVKEVSATTKAIRR